jgi:truncated hemoglobin YjbI
MSLSKEQAKAFRLEFCELCKELQVKKIPQKSTDWMLELFAKTLEQVNIPAAEKNGVNDLVRNQLAALVKAINEVGP